MTRTEALAILRGYMTDVEAIFRTGDAGKLAQLQQDRISMLVDAAKALNDDVEALLKEQADGPFTRLLESFWISFKANDTVNTVNDALQQIMAQQHMAQQGALEALNKVADDTLGGKKK